MDIATLVEQYVLQVTIGAVVLLVLTGGAVVGITTWLRPKILLKKRLTAIGVLGDRNASDRAEGRRQKRIQEKLKQLEHKKDDQGFKDKLRLGLIQAGVEMSIQMYFIYSAIAAVVLVSLYLILGFSVFGVLPVALAGGLGLPRWLLNFAAAKRQKIFTRQFADAIDVVVRGIRSGLPVAECFYVIAREFKDPVATEFKLIMEGQNIGLPLEEVMRRALERIPTAEYKFFSIVIQIQQQTGGNLGETLANLSGVIRDRKKMRDKVSALSNEAKASAMIIGALPFLVMTALAVINPAYLIPLFEDPWGHMMLGACALSMLLGVLIMNKMINFEM